MARLNRGWRSGSIKGRLLRYLLAGRGLTVVGLDATGKCDVKVIRETRERVPLLMQDMAALQILACVRAARELDVAMAEAGVFKGGSARLICEAKGSAPLHLFDAFELLQGEQAGKEDTAAVTEYFGSFHSELAEVKKILRHYEQVYFHPGHFPQSACALTKGERFGFLHLDLDLAQGTLDALEFFWPRLVPGAIVICDDYNLPAVRNAFNQFVAGRPERPVVLPWSQVMVVKGAP